VNETGSLRVSPAGALLGELTVPGDKSVSHRAVMLGALAEEMVTVDGFGASADTLATIDVFRRMGVRIDHPEPGHRSSRASGCAGCDRPTARSTWATRAP
jgi:5-enolpyruvylshikimate-3-phosphate synthase